MNPPGRRRIGAAAVVLASVVSVLAVSAPAESATRLVRNDHYTGAEDTVLRVPASTGVLANDPVRRAARRLSVVKAPARGTVVLGKRGAFRYRPAAEWSGRDTFLYRVVDARGRRSVAVARIEIRPADDPTHTSDDAATVAEDGVVTGNVLANDADIDSPLRILEDNHGRAPGSFEIRPDGDWTYAPAANWSGVATIGYATTTGGLGTLTIAVTPIDDPTLTESDVRSIPVDSPQVSDNVLSNDVDVDSSLSVIAFDLVPEDDGNSFGWDPDGRWYYEPRPGWTGTETGTYTTNTGATGVLTITVG
jgi:hypothetical protein